MHHHHESDPPRDCQRSVWPGHALAVALGTVLLSAIAVRLWWLGDDAFITLRTVENLVGGNGARWNVADRVQTYTHPLWFLLLAGARALTGELMATTLVVSLLLSGAAFALILASTRSGTAMLATAMLLAATRAFVDFTSSGLETPLTYCLVAAFAGAIANDSSPAGRCGRALVLLALLVLTRFDLLILVAPAALAAGFGVRWRTLGWQCALAALPVAAWLGFACSYYGDPWPVSAHAKVWGHGLAAADLLAQGAAYLWFTATDDPALVATIVVGGLVAVCSRRTRWLGLGIVLYLGYVIVIGGDFMAGRMLLPPFVAAAAILARALHAFAAAWRRSVIVLAIGAAARHGLPAWLSAPSSEMPPTAAQIAANHGVCDERRFYARRFGWFGRERDLPRFDSAPLGGDPGPRWFWVMGTAGAAGFRAGVSGHVVDPLLCDPLLARLPAIDPGQWRPGHVRRRVPEGYLESLLTGENRIHHDGLARYFAALRTVTQAPVFDAERLATVWRLWRGDYDGDLRAFVREHYYTPPRVSATLRSLPGELPNGTLWYAAAPLRFVGDGGLAVACETQVEAERLRLQTVGLYRLRIRLRLLGAVVGEVTASPAAPAATADPWRVLGGLRTDVVKLPAATRFDELWIDAESPGPGYTIGPAALGAIQCEGR